MVKYITISLVIFMFYCAAVLGAWLAGADPSAWTFIVGAGFSFLLGLAALKKDIK